MEVTSQEKKKYVFKEKRDFTILKKIKELEREKLDSKDKEIVKLIRTQLEDGWRTPLIKYLDKLKKKYKCKSKNN